MDLSKLKVTGRDCEPAVITSKNLNDAMLLQEDYGSAQGETTAVMTYIYQHYIVKPYQPEIADILEKIAIQEMRHHDILGTMIVALGGNPVIGSNNRYWNGGFVDYSRNINEMMINNIRAEETAIRNYRKTIEKLQTKEIVPVIECIIEDEKVHIEAFAEILKYVSFWK